MNFKFDAGVLDKVKYIIPTIYFSRELNGYAYNITCVLWKWYAEVNIYKNGAK